MSEQAPTPDALTEMLARMWMTCDPNRGGSDPDQLMPATVCTGGTSSDGGKPRFEEYPNPLAGKPQWHWFIPRAEATKHFLVRNGYELRKIDASPA